MDNMSESLLCKHCTMKSKLQVRATIRHTNSC